MSKRPTNSRSSVTSGSSLSPGAIVGIVVGVIAVVGLIAMIVVSTSGGSGSGAEAENQPVTVKGASLPTLPESGTDPADGLPAPTLQGENFAGDAVATSGGPTMLVFAAHWCPHCQKEVPNLATWMDDGLLPKGVSTTLISTSVKDQPGVDPPSVWVDSTGWDKPVIADDTASTAAASFGVGSFPFFVFVDGDGNVSKRTSGELSRQEIEGYLQAIAPSAK